MAEAPCRQLVEKGQVEAQEGERRSRQIADDIAWGIVLAHPDIGHIGRGTIGHGAADFRGAFPHYLGKVASAWLPAWIIKIIATLLQRTT